jgi:hypothetical protein
MSIAQSLLPELDQEMAGTRKTLERIPEDKFEWRPHPKSFTMIALATHIANMVGWGRDVIEEDSFDVAPPGAEPYREESAGSVAALLAMFDRNYANLRGDVLNHLVHHRAQLGVYLRLNDAPVPALYGPSADEDGM